MRTVVAIVFVSLAVATARADAPTFAIDLRGRDKLADPTASSMENALRAAGSAKGARYRAVGTRKDRIAASTDDCPSALTVDCAVEIGERLGVDYMISGEIELRGGRYTITINVTNVRTKKRVRSVRDLATTKTVHRDVKKWSKRVWARLVDDATGSLIVTSNAQRGRIFVDGQFVAELYNGRATIDGLGLGTHAVELRADGYKPFAGETDVDGNTPLNVLLVKAP